MLQSFNSDIHVLISDLNYDSQPDRVTTLTRNDWYRKQKYNGRHLYQRITFSRFLTLSRELESAEFHRQYSKAIQDRYNVGPNWMENSWFVEQVRPTIFY